MLRCDDVLRPLMRICLLSLDTGIENDRSPKIVKQTLHDLILWPGHPSRQERKLENVAIANALQVEAARRSAVPERFNFVAHAKFEVDQPIRCRLIAFFLLIRYVTL